MDDRHLDLLKELLDDFKDNLKKVAGTVDILIDKVHDQELSIQNIENELHNYVSHCPYDENKVRDIVDKAVINKLESLTTKKESQKINKTTIVFMICSLIIAGLSLIFTITANTTLVKKEIATDKQESVLAKQNVIERKSFDSLAVIVKELQNKK
jgi:ABC-type antimicrobial peptide transport system permease subunit